MEELQIFGFGNETYSIIIHMDRSSKHILMRHNETHIFWGGMNTNTISMSLKCFPNREWGPHIVGLVTLVGDGLSFLMIMLETTRWQSRRSAMVLCCLIVGLPIHTQSTRRALDRYEIRIYIYMYILFRGFIKRLLFEQEFDGISIVYPFMLLASRYLPIPFQL